MRQILARIDGNDNIKNKTATEGRNIKKIELGSVINRYVPMEKQGKGPRRNICQKRLSEILDINKICGGFINIRLRIKIMKFIKKQ